MRDRSVRLHRHERERLVIIRTRIIGVLVASIRRSNDNTARPTGTEVQRGRGQPVGIFWSSATWACSGIQSVPARTAFDSSPTRSPSSLMIRPICCIAEVSLSVTGQMRWQLRVRNSDAMIAHQERIS